MFTRHISEWSNVTAAILKVRRKIHKPTLSIDVYLLEKEKETDEDESNSNKQYDKQYDKR